MKTHVAVSDKDIVHLIAEQSMGVVLERLADLVLQRYGPTAVFHTCSRIGLDLDDLIVLLEARHRVQVIDGVIFAEMPRMVSPAAG